MKVVGGRGGEKAVSRDIMIGNDMNTWLKHECGKQIRSSLTLGMQLDAVKQSEHKQRWYIEVR
jgi:hypothetical protein